jgi:hypothetical protein
VRRQRIVKRKAEADAKPLTCATCGGAFSDTKHLKPNQVEHHRKAKGAKVVCGGCKDFGFTARSCQPYQCSGACERRLPKSAFPDPHIVPRDANKRHPDAQDMQLMSNRARVLVRKRRTGQANGDEAEDRGGDSSNMTR